MKPQLIAHRINTIKQLQQTPTHLGVEIDLRSQGTKIILHHDPFCEGEDFDLWLKHFHHQTLILNVKEEGLEKAIISKLLPYGIHDYFFLDVSFPFLIWLSNEGITQIAVRFSEFESLETVLNVKNRVQWVWVDCFTKLPLDLKVYERLKDANFKLCLVSPELQKRSIDQIQAYAQNLQSQNIVVDAICTKRPDLWKNVYQVAE